jgi:hypothetical protein
VVHPAKVYPARVNVFVRNAVDTAVVIDCVTVDGEPVPSLALNVIVLESAVHCAYSVALEVNGYEAPSRYDVPDPFAAVFQPVKV